MSSAPRHLHQAFGLAISSALPLPELLPAPEGAVPAIEIALGEVPPDLPDARRSGVRFQVAPGRLLLQVDGVARYLVADGRRVTIAPEPGAPEADVRAFLLTIVMGAVLHQREDLVLHGSAVEIDGHAVGFLGHSGTGKSTTAAAFRRRGFPVITDDLLVVRPLPDGRHAAQPSFPHMKLWLDSLRKLDLSPDGLRRIRDKLEKRALPLGADFAAGPRPLRRLYVLHWHNQDEVVLKPVAGVARFHVLKNQTYRFGFVAGGAQQPRHFGQALALAREVPLVGAARPAETLARLDELLDAIQADLRA